MTLFVLLKHPWMSAGDIAREKTIVAFIDSLKVEYISVSYEVTMEL